MKKNQKIVINVPDPNLYKPLYKGRIYWVFENNPDQPFEGWTVDSDVLLWDRNISTVLACGKYQEDGSIEGCANIGQGVTFHASDPIDIVSCFKSIEKWSL